MRHRRSIIASHIARNMRFYWAYDTYVTYDIFLKRSYKSMNPYNDKLETKPVISLIRHINALGMYVSSYVTC
jgi:hypothetical protein